MVAPAGKGQGAPAGALPGRPPLGSVATLAPHLNSFWTRANIGIPESPV